MPSRQQIPVIRAGVDAGGTFTDCVVVTADRRVHVLKVFSTPDDPARGIVEGVRQLLDAACSPSGQNTALPTIQLEPATSVIEIIHGTTVGTNTLLERKGARVALVTTAGFEDVIEIGRQNRPRLYDLGVTREPPLVPRERRFGAHERTAADGTILKAPSKNDLRRLLARIRGARPESLAICFLFSYANPANERIVEDALAGLNLPLSVSHRILPEFREYERTSTIVANAYLAPRLGAYLGRLDHAFGGSKASASHVRISVMQSNGGITTAARAAREPVRTILSGPAGGVVAAARLAESLGIRQVISFDMGGTSTDVSLIDGAPRTTRETGLGGLPVAVPVLDVHSVGAGGGSLARIDGGGALRVGPESAGAVPGPVCYGRGGDRPTVTDAHLILGGLDPDNFLGGSFRLDLRAAHEAFGAFLKRRTRDLVSRSGLRTALDLARGVVAVANATMERALRVVSIERGHDARDFALICFGGAGGLHAADLARALDMKQVIVPANPGAFSALGVLLSDIVKDVSRSLLMPIPMVSQARKSRGPFSSRFMPMIKQRFEELESSARAELGEEGFGGQAAVERALDLRYSGQSYELTVPFAGDFRQAFHREHERAYGHSQPDRSIEVVSIRIRLTIKTPKPGSPTAASRAPSHKPKQKSIVIRKPVWFDIGQMDTAFYDRSRLSPGVAFNGPAVVLEYSATTVVPPDFHCRVDDDGNLILQRQGHRP